MRILAAMAFVLGLLQLLIDHCPHMSQASLAYEETIREINLLVRQLSTWSYEVEWTSIQINSGSTTWQGDKGNAGNSVTMSLGDMCQAAPCS